MMHPRIPGALELLVLVLIPMLEFYRLTLLAFNQDGAVHLLQSLFSVPVGIYSTSRRLFACIREFPTEGLLAVLEVVVDAFVVWRAVRYVPRANHVSHLGGVPFLTSQLISCNRSNKISMGDGFIQHFTQR